MDGNDLLPTRAKEMSTPDTEANQHAKREEKGEPDQDYAQTIYISEDLTQDAKDVSRYRAK